MLGFTYYTPTKVAFGKGSVERVGELMKQFGGTRVLIHYGGQSAVRSGVLDRVKKSLDEAGIFHVELGGVVPNPHLAKVREGIELSKANGVDFLLAVGGGSVIDSCKAIAYGLAEPEHDVWELYAGQRKAKACFPVASVLTIAAAGSEMSNSCVIPNTMDADLEKRAANVEHLKKVIRASHKLGVNLVTTFIGRDQTKNVEENLELVKEVWPPIIAEAEKYGVKIGIENCPMLFGPDQWPGGQNLMTTPANWRKVFEILPSDNLGINYDPSHFVWQMIDYIKPIYEFKDKIFHVHFKDIKLYQDKLDQVGVMAYPLEFMAPKLPGLGDVDWGRYVSALTDIGYDGPVCIEVEDRAFEGSREKILDSLRLSKKYMENFVI